MFQPVSLLSLDERSECDLGWRAEVESRKWLVLDDTLSRMALRDFQPLTAPSVVLGEPEVKIGDFGRSSLETLSSVVSALFSSLTPSSRVEGLLVFFWNILTGLSG